MIHFFRRIRKGLLSQNRFSKYMLYAVGEIALVMIGILLALQVNNWNEQRKINNEIERVLTLFEQELETNIKECNSFLRYGYVMDSIQGLFNKELVTPEMLRENPGLMYRDFGTRTINFLEERLNELISMEKRMPRQYQHIIPQLHVLKTRIESQKYWESEALKLAMSRAKERIDELPWAYKEDSLSVEKAINYVLNNPFYRNKVRHYYNLQLDENVWDASLIRTSSVALLWKIKMIRKKDHEPNVKEFFKDLQLILLLEYDCMDTPYKLKEVGFRRNLIIYNHTKDSTLINILDSLGQTVTSGKIPPKSFLLGENSLEDEYFIGIQKDGECLRVYNFYKEDFLLIE